MKGEVGPNLFPKPVYEEAPFKQREKVYEQLGKEFKLNQTKIAGLNASPEAMDVPRYKALCRGEELRVIPPSSTQFA